MEYIKPIMVINNNFSESVYLASGSKTAPSCDSLYMNGQYKPQNYVSGVTDNYTVLGCTGCPAFRYDSCGLQSDYIESNYASSYDADNGKRMPEWERLGKSPTADYWN